MNVLSKKRNRTIFLFLLVTMVALVAAAGRAADDWQQQGDSMWFAGRYGHDMAYLNDNHIVMFGGWSTGRLSDTSIYTVSSDSWFQVCGVCAPSYRYNHAMSYVADNKALMFGGSVDYSTSSNESWIYTYNGSWSLLSPTQSPSARFGHGMAYIGDDKVLLFGGKAGVAAPMGDTWVFDLSDNTWTQLYPPTSPSARFDFQLAYLGQDRVLLFGGSNATTGLGDTWLFDLSDGTWTNVSPASGPGSRFSHAMAYIGNGQAVLNGGYGPGPGVMGGVYDDTWVYDSAANTWTQDVESGGPSARQKHRMCPTSMTGPSKAVLYGGAHNWALSSLSLETWTFGGGDYVVFPDLTVTAGAPLVTPATAAPGQTVTAAELTLRNLGSGSAGSFQYGYFLSTDAVITAADYQLASYSVTGLAGGAQQIVPARDLVIPASAEGGYQYFGVLVDLAGTVGESNETNNSISTAFSLVNTPPGTGVVVEPLPGVSVGFAEVTSGGNTSADMATGNPGPDLPGYMFRGNYYDITTTAGYTGEIEICLQYDDTGMTLFDEFSLRLFHLDGGVWIDITTSIQTGDNIICGTVTSLSWFGVALFQPWRADQTSPLVEDTNDAIGVSWVDYDMDGDQDFYVTNHTQPDKLFRNDGGGVFVDVTAAPLGHAGQGSHACWGDYDGDGDPDLYLTVRGGANMLYRNDGGSFVDVTAAPLNDPGESQGAGWADYDRDGDLDLYVANYYEANRLYRNEGGGVFVDATSAPLDDTGQGSGVSWADYDNDGDPDLYLTNTNGTNKLFRNDGPGVFTDVTPGALAGSAESRSAAWGDYDNDGDLDLYLVNAAGANKLFRNDDGGSFTDVTGGLLADAGNGRCATWGDYDNDGDLDLYVTNLNAPNVLIRNEGGGAFSNGTVAPLNDGGYGFGAGWADYDGDGDLDLYLANAFGANRLFRNDLGGSNHWLHIRLTGVASNRAGIGARVRVVAGGLTQIREVGCGSGYLSENSLLAAFGLGAHTTVDLIQVTWPSGIVNNYTEGLVIDRVLVLGESSGGATATPDTPGRTRMFEPVPNPFNAQTVLAFNLAEEATVSLRIYDLAGRLVDVLLDHERGVRGRNEFVWQGRDQDGRLLPTGIYFCRFDAGAYSETKSLMMVK